MTRKVLAMSLAIALAGMFAFGPDPAQAQLAAASQPADQALSVTVVSVTGSAQKLVATDGKQTWQDMKAGEELGEMTVIRTGLRSKVVLKFRDRGEVTVGSATKVGISTFRQQPRAVQTQLGIKYGTLHVNVGSSRGPNDFRVATPVATLSVRGTAGDLSYFSDVGLTLHGLHGTWSANSDTGEHRNVGPGEETGGNNGMLASSLALFLWHLNTFPGDFFGGLDGRERWFLIYNGQGRGAFVPLSIGQSQRFFATGSRITGAQALGVTTGAGAGAGSGPPTITLPGGDIDIGGLGSGNTGGGPTVTLPGGDIDIGGMSFSQSSALKKGSSTPKKGK